MMEPSSSVRPGAQLLAGAGGRSDSTGAQLHEVSIDLAESSPDGVRSAFERCLNDEGVLGVLWNLGEELELTQKLSMKAKLKKWWTRFKKHFISGLMELILSLPSIAILPILLLTPYLSTRVAPIPIFLCAGLVAVSVVISLLRVKAERDETLELLRKASEGAHDAGALHPPLWAFLKSDLISSWACGAVELVGLLVLGARMARNADVVSYEGYMVPAPACPPPADPRQIFFIFPIADAMRGLYDARVLDKMPSILAYDGAGFLPTRRPLRFDPALTKFEEADPARVRPIPYGALRALKLGASRVKEGDASALDLPFLFHVLFLQAPAAPASSHDDRDLDASRITCFRVLPGGVRERSQAFQTSVAARDARDFLALLAARCRGAKEVAAACGAAGRFLAVLEAAYLEESVRKDKAWLVAQMEGAFQRQTDRAFIGADAGPDP